jgi:hypothetical protein
LNVNVGDSIRIVKSKIERKEGSLIIHRNRPFFFFPEIPLNGQDLVHRGFQSVWLVIIIILLKVQH